MLPFISNSFTALGEVIVAFTVIAVHHRFMKEHRVDNKLFKTMEHEQKLAFVGVTFIILGWTLNTIDLFLI